MSGNGNTRQESFRKAQARELNSSWPWPMGGRSESHLHSTPDLKRETRTARNVWDLTGSEPVGPRDH